VVLGCGSGPPLVVKLAAFSALRHASHRRQYAHWPIESQSQRPAWLRRHVQPPASRGFLAVVFSAVLLQVARRLLSQSITSSS
jgi:hypothetical protein